MQSVTKPKIATSFSFSTGSWLKWDDEAPALNQEEKSEDDQSIDSDHSSDFFHNFNPQIERMIIARRAVFLQNLEEQIAKDEAKLPPKQKPIKPKQKTHTLEKCSCGALLSKNKVAKHLKTRVHQEALDKRTQPQQTQTPTEQLNDRLDKLENEIETAIAKAKEENKPKPPVRIVNLLKEKSPVTTNPLTTYWKFPCQPNGKEPRCKWRRHECQSISK